MGTLDLPLRYLIGIDNPGTLKGYITEVSYNSTHGDIGYCNLFDEENSGQYGPYKHDSDTAKDYGEGEIDATGAGWHANLSQQFERRRNQGFKFIELDNPDAYEVKYVLQAIELAQVYNLKVIAKNPGAIDPSKGDPIPYVAKCYGIIVEKDAGETREGNASPEEMDNLRKQAGKPEIPVWFVSFTDGYEWIKSLDITPYDNMYKSYSRHGEYKSYEEI